MTAITATTVHDQQSLWCSAVRKRLGSYRTSLVTGYRPTFVSRRGGQVREVKQNTAVTISVFMQSVVDATGIPGLAAIMIVNMKKSGGAFAVIAPTIVDKGSGWYDIPLTIGNTDTLGSLTFHITAAGFASANDEVQLLVIAIDKADAVHMGVSSLSGIDTLVTGVAALMTVTDEIHKAAYGRWKIVGTQLIIYDDDGTTPLQTFDLKDDTGTPSSTKIYERVPLP